MNVTQGAVQAADRWLLDPIGMAVFSNHLLSIAENMGNLLVRSSFSSNIKERRDCSVSLFAARGRLIAQASDVPPHLGSLLGGVRAVFARYALAYMREGDAFISSDPYLAGGAHTPDIAIVIPVFHDGTVRLITANIDHHSDFGGAVPGSIFCTARSVFEEGLRLPVIRVARADRLDHDLLNLIVQNTREPEDRARDIRAQIAVNEKGGAMTRRLVQHLDIEAVERSIEDILADTNRRLRNRVAQLKDDSYGFTTFLDDDRVDGDPVPLHATVPVAGEEGGDRLRGVETAGPRRQGVSGHGRARLRRRSRAPSPRRTGTGHAVRP